jgi:hypothetical protein
MSRLSEFLRKGCLDSLTLGTSRAAVIASLGNPDEATGFQEVPELWKYQSLQVAFMDNSVCFIGLYLIEGKLCLPNALKLDGYQPTSATNVVEFETYLLSQHIQFKTDPVLTFGSQLSLKLGSGLRVYFIDDELNSLQLADYRVNPDA